MKINIEKCNDYFDMSIKFDIRQVLNIELKIVNANGYEIGAFSKEQLVYPKRLKEKILFLKIMYMWEPRAL